MPLHFFRFCFLSGVKTTSMAFFFICFLCLFVSQLLFLIFGFFWCRRCCSCCCCSCCCCCCCCCCRRSCRLSSRNSICSFFSLVSALVFLYPSFPLSPFLGCFRLVLPYLFAFFAIRFVFQWFDGKIKIFFFRFTQGRTSVFSFFFVCVFYARLRNQF